jgi:hypothetical protein
MNVALPASAAHISPRGEVFATRLHGTIGRYIDRLDG